MPDNNTAERAMKPVAIGRLIELDSLPDHNVVETPMAIAFTLIETAKLNGVDPQAWLTMGSGACPPTIKCNRLDELMPWNYSPEV